VLETPISNGGKQVNAYEARSVGFVGVQPDFALVDFFALIGPTDPLGFLESGFLGTSFSIRNSLPHFGHVRRDIKSLSMIVPMTKGVLQCGQEMRSSR
jgi:hypothetical protein